MQNINELIPQFSQATEASVCPEHGEYFAITLLGHTAGCMTCTEQRVKQETRNRLREIEQRQKEAIRAERFVAAQIPIRFAGFTFDKWIVNNKNQQQALNFSRAYAENFSDRMKDGGGLIFCGNAGTGKTSLAIAILQAVLEQGFTGRYLSVVSATGMLKDAWRKANITEADVLAEIQKPDLLILDEAGVQFETDVEVQLIYKIVNARYENCRPIIFTSNDDIDDMQTTMGERVIDRMRENGKTFPFDWDSFRKAGNAK